MKGKILIIVAISLIIVGALLFVFALSMSGWDFGAFNTQKVQLNEYVITDDFDSVAIITDTTDIFIVPTSEEYAKLVAYEEENLKHELSFEDGTLRVELRDTRKFYEYIQIVGEDLNMTLYLPLSEYKSIQISADTSDVKIANDFRFENIDVKLSTGDIDLDNISCGDIVLNTTTGDIDVDKLKCDGEFVLNVTTGESALSDVLCNNFISDGNTGEISLERFVANEKINITRTTGDVSFVSSDAQEIKVKTDTGDVSGSLLSEKVFVVKTSTGDTEYPKSTSGGICDITTSTGDGNIYVK